MSARAAEMARIMKEEWPDEESVESLWLRRFANDRLSDLELAIEIFDELEKSDEAAELVINPPIGSKEPDK